MKAVIVGGAGFIGANTALFHLGQGDEVVILDNFSRYGTLLNVQMLENKFKNGLRVVQGDIRLDRRKLEECVAGADRVYHFAAQTAVTSSVLDPREDFEINALGTFNVLEAIRVAGDDPVVMFSSSKKVYGNLADIKIAEHRGRYGFEELPDGLDETRPMDCHSPYACSKGAADLYVRDYSRIYDLRTIVFRQSCICGLNQFGVEEQGWVSHMIISALYGKPVTIYGDGKQVRDLLYVTDLIRAYDLAAKNIDQTAGQVYNIGGGPKNALSVIELAAYVEELTGKKVLTSLSDWRPGDQPVFVCNTAKAKRDFGWTPEVTAKNAVKMVYEWSKQNKDLFAQLYK